MVGLKIMLPILLVVFLLMGLWVSFFALSLGVDDLRCNRFGSICGNAYFAV